MELQKKKTKMFCIRFMCSIGFACGAFRVIAWMESF